MHEPAVSNLSLEDVVSLDSCASKEGVLAFLLLEDGVDAADEGRSHGCLLKVPSGVRGVFRVPDHVLSWKRRIFVFESARRNAVEYILGVLDSVVVVKAVVA